MYPRHQLRHLDKLLCRAQDIVRESCPTPQRELPPAQERVQGQASDEEVTARVKRPTR